MKAALLAFIMLGTASAHAQTWPPRPAGPIDDAARARQDHERWRSGFEARELEQRRQQLQTTLTVQDLQAARAPTPVAPVTTPWGEADATTSTVTASPSGLSTDEARRRLDAMDSWTTRNRIQP